MISQRHRGAEKNANGSGTLVVSFRRGQVPEGKRALA
jgi:hypothetical protein